MPTSRPSWLLPAVGLLVCSVGCGRDARPSASRAGYPPTRTVPVVDDYHGTRVADPYRWLEDLGSEEVRGWAAAQTAFAEPQFRDNAVRPWLVARMQTLAEAWDLLEASTSTAVREAAFQLTAVPNQRHRVLTVASADRTVACWWIRGPRDIQHRITVFERNGTRLRDFELPPMTRVLSVATGQGPGELVTETMSFLQPPTRIRHDLLTGVQMVVRDPPKAFAADQLEASQVWYRSKDGTKIPMFLVHRKGIERNGTHPVLLHGYGASSQVMGPFYGEKPDRVDRDGRHRRPSGSPWRWRVRPRLVRGGHAGTQAEHVRRLHRRGGLSDRRALHIGGEAGDQWGVQWRSARGRGDDPAARPVRGGDRRGADD